MPDSASGDGLPDVARLFFDVADLTPEARAERLAGVAPEVRAEVDALVDADREADTRLGRLDRLAPEAASGLGEGERIGRYVVETEIGRGGMGVVYRARDERLGRTVALKVLPLALGADPEARARLEAEARAASALDHPHVCTVHALEETDGGRLVLVLAHYEGETLKARLRNGPLAPEAAARVVREVASGLGAAHAAGIVHRDVKPSNVLLTDAGAKVLDFGIARSAESDLTRTGTTLGTAAYMAPEQTRGERADARADVWALGVCLHEMLTGDRPFRGRGDALVHAIRHDDPSPLSEATAAPLARVARRALAKDPADRYADADALLADLDAPVASPRRLWRWVAAAVALVYVAVIGWSALSARGPAEDTFVIAVAPFSALGDGAAEEADLMQTLIQRELDAVLGEEPDVIIVEAGRAAPTTDDEARAVGEASSAHLVLWGEAAVLRDEVEIRPRMTRGRAVEGILAPPERRVQGSGEVFTTLASDDQITLRRTSAAEVGDLALLIAAHYQIARGRFGQAQALYDRVRTPSPESDGGAAVALMLEGEHARALERFERAEALGSLPDPMRFAQASAFVNLGRIAEAETTMRQAVADNPDDVSHAVVLAWILAIQHRYEESATLSEPFVSHVPESQLERLAVGWANFMTGRFVASAAAFRDMAAHAGNPREEGWAYQGLGQALFVQGKFAEAAGAARYAVAADARDSESYHTLGWSLFAIGELSGAEEAFGQVAEPQFELEAALMRAYVRKQLSHPDALEPVTARVDTLGGDGLYEPVFRFIVGRATEAEVLAASARVDPVLGSAWRPQARLALGTLYETGLGSVPRDRARAEAHLTHADLANVPAPWGSPRLAMEQFRKGRDRAQD